MYAVKRLGSLQSFYFKIEGKKGDQIAMVATLRKLLEWIYHIIIDGSNFQELEKMVGVMGKS